MTQTLVLRPEVHAVKVGDDLVILDVAADRYLCLRQAGGARLSPGRESLDVDDPELAGRLDEAALLAPAGPGLARAALPPTPTRSAIPADIPRPDRRDLGPATTALAELWRGYRGRSFAEILARGAGVRGRPPVFTDALASAVLRYHAWAPYAPVPTKCLLRAFLLLCVLKRQGLDALWVFGVRTWPFHAHCWLQVEDVVLDDPAERTWAYSPILVA